MFNRQVLAPRKLEAQELREAQVAMQHLARGAYKIAATNSRQLNNIYRGGLAIPSIGPILSLTENTDAYIALAGIGTMTLGHLERISKELKELADPNTDIYLSSETISNLLLVIGKDWFINSAGSLYYGHVIGRREKRAFNYLCRGYTAAEDASAFRAFAQVFPPDYRRLCLRTHTNSEKIREAALLQRDRADGLKLTLQETFRQDLLPYYADEIARLRKELPQLNKLRVDARTKIGTNSRLRLPDPSLKESDLVGPTLTLIEAMRMLKTFRELYILRASGAIALSDAGVVAEAVFQSTGGKALLSINQLGLLLILHYLRMIVFSLLTVSVKLGGQDADIIQEYFEAAAAEDQKLVDAVGNNL